MKSSFALTSISFRKNILGLMVVAQVFFVFSCKRNSIVNIFSSESGLSWTDSEPVNMGLVSLGSAASKTFTLENHSSYQAVNCLAPSLSDALNFEIVSTTCQSTMAAGSSCEVLVEAKPQSMGFKDLTLSVTCDLDTVTKTPTAGARVNGVSTDLSWSPTTTQNFNTVAVGTQSASSKTYTLTNTGAASATGCSNATLTNLTDFIIIANTCVGTTLGAGSSCQVAVKARPQSAGQKNTSVTRTCTQTGIVATLPSKTTVTGEVPVLAWGTTSYNFGSIQLGNESSFIFNLNNTAVVAAATGCSAPTLSNTTDFYFGYDHCSTNNLSVGMSCDIEVRAAPQSLGLKTTTVSRTCSVGGVVKTVTNGIQVTGLAAPATSPSLAWSPLTNNFGSVDVGSNSVTQIFTLTNSGTGNATSCGLASLSNATDFSITADTCGLSNVNSSGGSCTVTVKANPSSTGVKTATLSRTCGVGGTVSTTTDGLTVTGTVPAPPALAWSPLTRNFGSVNVGSDSTTQVFTLTNSGGSSATSCSSPTVSNTTDFIIVSNGCGTNDLSNSSSCTVTLKAHPLSAGAKTATLSRTCTVGGTASTTTNNIVVTGVTPVFTADWQFSFGESTGNIHFGLATVGKSSNVFDILFRNPNGSDLTGCTLAQLSNAADFSIVNDTCGTGTLTAANYCIVQVRSHPQSVATVSTTLTRSCTETGSVTRTIDSSGASAANAIQISSGYQHSCVVMSDGTVKCWGHHGVGQLGNGQTSNNSATPVFVSNLSNAVSVSSAYNHSCAVLLDGTVQCWGSGDFAQLGNGTYYFGTSVPVPVIGLSGNATSVATNRWQTCALILDGTVQCWGYRNSYYNTPTTVPSLTDVTKISVGDSHACVLINDGTVKCWGSNWAGQLGKGAPGDSAAPVLVSGVTGALAVSSGINHSCALISDGTVKCWGYNGNGQLGDGTTTNNMSPVAVSGLSGVSAISLGTNHSCAVLSDGTAQCWGNNSYGQLGDRTMTDRYTPVSVLGLSDVASISGGDVQTCAIITGGETKCWGEPMFGLLGDGRQLVRVIPTQMFGLSNVASLIMGPVRGCVILSDETVKCWGTNISQSSEETNYGRFGDGTTLSQLSPTVISGLTGVKSMSLGYMHSCATFSGGTAKCWGANRYGRLGNGNSVSSSSPVPVSGMSNASTISTGYDHTCALLTDGTVKCWGGNSYGQLGTGNNTYSSVPVPVINVTDAVLLTVEGRHACAIILGGTVKCWGDNGQGQLGNGNNTDSSTPVLVSGISNAVNIVMSQNHTCALLSDGTASCWGYNSYGQLGDGTTTSRNVPVAVVGISTATKISAGGGFGCVVLSDGLVKCWGDNYVGELGIGESGVYNKSTIPKTVLGLKNVVDLSLLKGDSSTPCAIKNTGDIYCWGVNSSSETGFDETYIRSVSGL